MQQITIIGYLGLDPELRFTASGQKVTTFRVAVHQRKAGSEETLWWKVSLWGENRLTTHFRKGSSIIVVGEINKPEIYTDREGKQQISLNMTAYQIAFNPFGRTDRSEERPSLPDKEGKETPSSQKESTQEKWEREFQNMEQPKTAHFPDEEIPF